VSISFIVTLYIQEECCKGVEWIQLAYDREKGTALLKKVIKLWVTKILLHGFSLSKCILFMPKKMKGNL
jgi:hypothetical protein